MISEQSIIQLRGITKKVTDGSHDLEILTDCDLTVNQGEMVAIMGRSGSGKTTLLKLISLQDLNFRGSYLFMGQDVKKWDQKTHFHIMTQEIAFIYQDFLLIDDFTIIENVCLPLGYRGMRKKDRERKARKMIEKVGLIEKEKTPIRNLSGGEKQRVCIARALVQEASIILADEPTGNLDVRTARNIIDLLVQVNEAMGVTILLVTHDKEIAKHCSKILFLEKGHLSDATV